MFIRFDPGRTQALKRGCPARFTASQCAKRKENKEGDQKNLFARGFSIGFLSFSLTSQIAKMIAIALQPKRWRMLKKFFICYLFS